MFACADDTITVGTSIAPAGFGMALLRVFNTAAEAIVRDCLAANSGQNCFLLLLLLLLLSMECFVSK